VNGTIERAKIAPPVEREFGTVRSEQPEAHSERSRHGKRKRTPQHEKIDTDHKCADRRVTKKVIETFRRADHRSYQSTQRKRQSTPVKAKAFL